MSVGVMLTQAADGGGGEDDVANFAQPEQKDTQLMSAVAEAMTRLPNYQIQGSTVASSTSMTGMSSLIG